MTTWPDPARPGVPLNPKRDGWHFLRMNNGTLKVVSWIAKGYWIDPPLYAGLTLPETTADWCAYLGPVLTPDEATALQARVAELEAALAAAARVLHKAGEQFSEYAKQHAAKGTAVSDLKADFNKQWAERCFSAYWAANDAAEGGKDE